MMADRSRTQLALAQINFARNYTQRLLADIEDDLWFAQPNGAPNHIAWQIGHLAVAQYGLCLFRVRGRRASDQQLMPSKFRKQFSRGTTPQPDPAQNPSPQELRDVFDRIHTQANQELAEIGDADLTGEIEMPYAVEPTQLGGLYFCSAHEMLHAGQIGLIRRLIGNEPLG